MSEEIHNLTVRVRGPEVEVFEGPQFVYSIDDDEEVFGSERDRILGQNAIIGAVKMARSDEGRATLMSAAETIRIMRGAGV